MMKELMEIIIHCQSGVYVQGKHKGICMIPFTGETSGPWFQGKVIGIGTDTQQVMDGKITQLSARYMLEGVDYAGQKCRVFVENTGTDLENCHPNIVTDSVALAAWEEKTLAAWVEGWEDGVKVHIYEEEASRESL